MDDAKSLVPAETLYPLVIDDEALSSQDRRHPAIPIALVSSGELAQAFSDAFFCWPRCRGDASLGGAGLPDHLARPPLRDAEHTLEVRNGGPATTWAQKFPRAISFSATTSNSLSATIRFSVAFSRSSPRSRFASFAFIPPNWARQR